MSGRVRRAGLAAFLLFAVGALAGFAKRSAEPNRSRPAVEACTHERTTPPVTPREGSTCESDADCKDGRNGRCIQVHRAHGRMPSINQCTYDACFTDTDCGERAICECGREANRSGDQTHRCVAAECKTDRDCGDGLFCSPSYTLCGGAQSEKYYCHTPKDECMTDKDCPRPSKRGYGHTDTQCGFSPAKRRWICMSQQCPVG